MKKPLIPSKGTNVRSALERVLAEYERQSKPYPPRSKEELKRLILAFLEEPSSEQKGPEKPPKSENVPPPSKPTNSEPEDDWKEGEFEVVVGLGKFPPLGPKSKESLDQQPEKPRQPESQGPDKS